MSSRPTGDFPKIESWSIGKFEHDKQFDGVSCGLLCVMFIENIVIDNNKICRFTQDTITDIRKTYFDLLHNYSDNK